MKFRFACGAQLVINPRRRDEIHRRARQQRAAHRARKAKGRRRHRFAEILAHNVRVILKARGLYPSFGASVKAAILPGLLRAGWL